MALQNLISALGEEIQDPEEETFLLFSQDIPSQNLGFVNAKSTALEITVAGRDLTIQQSPTLLSSNRERGTTGAVVWKITPLLAEWIAIDENILFQAGGINQDSIALELGCGISGIIPSVLAPKIGQYIATDQEYVFKLLKQNLDQNAATQKQRQNSGRHGKVSSNAQYTSKNRNIEVLALDWESSSVSGLPTLVGSGSRDGKSTIDLLIACDCIYNEALIDPFVRTCADICQLKATCPGKPTLCIIAQQLRSDSVFEAWLSVFHRAFRVWRMPDEILSDGLKENSGFVIHVGVLREVAVY